MNQKPIVTVTRPTLTPEERERRMDEARKSLAAFFEAYARRQNRKQEETA